MSEEITEALLESHYYLAFRRLLEEVFGRRVLRILKPSQRREVFLGFDQGFARSRGDVAVSRLLNDLREAIDQSRTSATSLWFGYFMQYKRVEEMTRRSKSVPFVTRVPYYRVALSLTKKKETGRSQHETLVRLSRIVGADVVYACPMLFHEDELHDEANVDDVRLVPVNEAPAGYLSDERHSIVFSSRNDPNPCWCSEPVSGSSYTFRHWLAQRGDLLKSPGEFREFLNKIAFELRGRAEYLYAGGRRPRACAEMYSPFLRIIEFGPR